MNNDLISREALKKALFEHCRSEEENFYHFWSDENLIALIDNAPTVEPEITIEQAIAKIHETDLLTEHDKMMKEQVDIKCKLCNKRNRPQGEWAFDEKGYFYCDQCGKYPHDQYATTDFCPNCGSDMRCSKECTDPIIKAIQENNAKYNERPSIDFSRMTCDLGENNEVKKNESY